MSEASGIKNNLERSLEVAESTDILFWANQHRKIQVDGAWKPFNLNREGREYNFLGDIYTALSLGHNTVIQKPTQVGATELALNAALFFLDKKSENVLYLLPNDNQVGDFTQSRVDPSINNSPYLNELFSDISRTSLKRTSNSTFYLRGSNSKQKLEEIPVGFIIRDELENMKEENADFALKRLGASQYKWRLDLSHPEYPGGPTDRQYQDSSMGRWEVKCPNCGTWQSLEWKPNFYNRDGIGCKSCDAKWNKAILRNGRWNHKEPDNPTRGFRFTQMLSPTVSMAELEKDYEEAVLEGGYKLEHFYHTVMAKPYVEEGNSLTRKDIKNAKGKVEDEPDSSVMGVDVGSMLHWWVQSGNEVVEVGKTEKFDRLHEPINRLNVKKVVIDAQPETKKARDFINEVNISGWLCRRSARLQSRRKVKDDEIKVNATEHHDSFVGQFNKNDIVLPTDLPEEAMKHLVAPVRMVEDGKARWEKNTNHYWDAGCYANEALDLKGSEIRIRSLT